MKAGLRHIDTRQLLIADGDPCLVLVFVDGRLHSKSRFGGGAGRGDEVDDGFIGPQRATLPVFRDDAEQPALNFIPLARAWREMTHTQRQLQLVGQFLQDDLPQAIAAAVDVAHRN